MDEYLESRYKENDQEHFCFRISKYPSLKSAIKTDGKGNAQNPIKGFSMNTKHLFIWNVLEAWKLKIGLESDDDK